MTSIRLLPIPAHDLALRLFANRALDRARTLQGLQRCLRLLFPEVRVRPRHELATIGKQVAWYVFRDRLYQPQVLRDWEHDDGSGRAVLDDIGDFVDVDDQAALLFGSRRAELLGTTWRTLYPPALAAWFDDIVPLPPGVGVLATRWLIHRPDGTTRYIDVRLVEDAVGSHRHGAAFRPVDPVVGRHSVASEGAGNDARPNDLPSALGATAPFTPTRFARGGKRRPRELGGVFT